MAEAEALIICAASIPLSVCLSEGASSVCIIVAVWCSACVRACANGVVEWRGIARAMMSPSGVGKDGEDRGERRKGMGDRRETQPQHQQQPTATDQQQSSQVADEGERQLMQSDSNAHRRGD